MTQASPTSCSIPELAFGSAAAREAKLAACVSRLNDGQAVDAFFPTCSQYVGAMAQLSRAKGCTLTSAEDVCVSIREHFTSELQREYCSALVESNDRFWSQNAESFGWKSLEQAPGSR